MQNSVILISGGTGLIGSTLTQKLLEKGAEVRHLSRSSKSAFTNVKTFVWDINKGKIDLEALKGVSTIIHLAGAGIADKPWSKSRKKEILDSRTKSIDLLYNACEKLNSFPDTFISASGIGWYGMQTASKIFKEEDEPANDFVADVCVAWEKAANQFSEKARTIILRTGIVLSTKGGALPKMDKPIRFFAGAPLGSGSQWMPWIHISDMVNMYINAIENSNFNGVYNAVCPESVQVTNKTLTKSIAKILSKPLILPNVPEFALKLLLGDLAKLVLEGSRVSAQKVAKTGFKFEFTNLEESLKNLYQNKI
jgi:uncharacterized protein (TIGR01777 family)